MSTLGIVALVLLAVVAAVLVIVAAVRLGRARRPLPGPAARANPSWYEVLLAAVLLAALVILVVSFRGPDGLRRHGGRGLGRDGTHSDLFLGVMLAVAALFVAVPPGVSAGAPRRQPAGCLREAEAGPRSRGTVRDPAGSRLAGLLLLVVGILLLGWVYLDPAARADLVGRVLYPAAVAVAIVLLFDKATRSWTPKSRTEGFREWLLCDVILIALILGFLNLEQLEARDAYRGFFWDMVHIAAFFSRVLVPRPEDLDARPVSRGLRVPHPTCRCCSCCGGGFMRSRRRPG